METWYDPEPVAEFNGPDVGEMVAPDEASNVEAPRTMLDVVGSPEEVKSVGATIAEVVIDSTIPLESAPESGDELGLVITEIKLEDTGETPSVPLVIVAEGVLERETKTAEELDPMADEDVKVSAELPEAVEIPGLELIVASEALT